MSETVVGGVEEGGEEAPLQMEREVSEGATNLLTQELEVLGMLRKLKA